MGTLTNRLATAILIFGAGVLSPAAERQKVSVSGRVVDWQARPVDGAEVAICEKIYDYSADRDVAQSRDEIKKTDHDGRFVFTADVTPSIYRVFIVARKPGLALGWDFVSHLEDNLIVLETPSTLAGVVVDAAGKPVEGAKVRAVPKTDYLLRLEQAPILAPEPWLTVETDSQGHFRFDGFSADVNSDFWIEAPGRDLAYVYSTHRMTVCGYEAGRDDVRLVVPAQMPVRGRVVEATTGRPIDGAYVLLHPMSPDPEANPFVPRSTTSGKDGRFMFRGVPHGQRYVNVSSPEGVGLVDKRVRFDVSNDGAGKEVLVSLEKGGTVELAARAETTGGPIGQLPVRFWEAVQDERSSFYKDIVTDSNGTALFSAPPGECRFSTRLDGYSPFTYDDQVLVAAGQTTKAQIVLTRDQAVQGLVVDEAGRPVPGAAVDTAFSDPRGRFEVRPASDNPAEKRVVRHAGRNLAAVVDIGARIVLHPALTIAGRITDPNGAGIPAARVALDILVRDRAGHNMASAYGHEFLTDFQGRYEMRAVAPESEGFAYRISINASGYETKNLQRISIRGEPGSRVTLEPIVLQPADQSVTGTVVDVNDRPIPDVPIVVHGRGQPTRHTMSDPNGRFVIRRVCKGPLRIQASFDRNAGFLRAEGGDRDVKIVSGQDTVHSRYASLKGKPLPELADVSVSHTPIEGKMVLVCFFDLQQRPSRSAILQLAKQADDLTQRGITVVAVQTTKLGRSELDKWAGDNDISLPIGSVGADEEKTRLAWGVQSLPWLILTDRAHVVTAEGIALTELTKP